MGKGIRKRNRTRFQKGNNFKPNSMVEVESPSKKVLRLSQADYNNCVQNTYEGKLETRSSTTGQAADTMILRPRESGEFYSEYNEDGSIPAGEYNINVVANLVKIMGLLSMVANEHPQDKCPKALFALDKKHTEKRGYCWALSAKCLNCSYVSGKYKLYEEVETKGPGRRKAAPNMGLQIGLSRQGIGYEGIADIMNACNIASPSKQSMQETANQVAPLIEDVNQQDMCNRIKELKNLNEKLGFEDDGLAIEADATYNNPIGSGLGKTPTQPATSVTYLAREQLTSQGQIICADHYQKICSCPKAIDNVHLLSCSANLPRDAVISNEGLYLEKAVKQISSDGGPKIGAITLDGDSNAASATKRMGATLFYCTTHLTRTATQHIKKVNFSSDMFAGRTKTDKEDHKKRFALDLAHRCQAELKLAAETYPGDLSTIHKKLSFVGDAVPACYMGDHRLCHEYSLVCKKGQQWQRPYMIATEGKTNPNDTSIFPTQEDLVKLKMLTDERFSLESLRKTFLNRTQNKCEAANRGVSKALPRRLEFRRNARGRVNAAVHSINNRPGQSLVQLTKAAGCPIARGSVILKRLKKQDEQVESDKKRQKSMEYIQGRAKRRFKKYRCYDKVKSEKCYKSGSFITATRTEEYKLQQATRQRANFTSNIEHAYAKDKTMENINKRKAVTEEHNYS